MPLADFIKEMTALLNSIPEEHRDDAMFDLDVDDDYYGGSSTVTTTVYYDRLETDAEVTEREAAARRSAEESRRYNEQRERQIYEQLKAKFEREHAR
jgi:hypothetical protein